MSWRVVACIASCAMVSAQPPTTLRTETRVVQIDVEVKDSRGQPVSGLVLDDFTITDSGKRRPIQLFSVEGGGTPAPRPPADPLPPNVFSNQSRFAPSATHATVILLDAINNYWDDVAAARARLVAMTEKLRSDERIAIYVATTQPAGVRIVQGFTTDRALLRRTIQAYWPPTITPAPGMISGPPPPPAEEEFRRRAAVTDTMAAFRLLAEHLGKLPGRKSLLWVTSGLPPRQLREMPDPYDRAAAALNEANIAVNVIDDDGVGDLHRRWGRESRWTLRQLADSTGGKAFVWRNDLENMLVEAIEAPRITYTLGFYLPDDERDEKFHPLTVRVNRRGLNLSYRKGYYAGAVPLAVPPNRREPLENFLLHPQDANEIEITAEVMQVPGGQLRVAMRLGAQQLSFQAHDDRWLAKVEEMFLETNAAGQVVARVSDTKEIRISQRLREQFAGEGVPLTQEMRLVETAARLLIVLRDAESGRTGTLSVPLIR